MADVDGQAIDSANYFAFKDCLAQRLLTALDLYKSSPGSEQSDSQLDDFTSYLSSETWLSLPHNIRFASYSTLSTIPSIDELAIDSTTPPTFTESLVSYGISSDSDSAVEFLRNVLEDYIKEACAPPPVWSATRTTECEICEREVPLTYHHLIPRSMHSKALKKKWHPQEMLNSVAWLCRPCHSAVHRVASNDDLARHYYTVNLLLEREDIQRWRKYAAKQRYGVKRG